MGSNQRNAPDKHRSFSLTSLLLLILQYQVEQGESICLPLSVRYLLPPNLGQMWCQQDGNEIANYEKYGRHRTTSISNWISTCANCLGESFNFADKSK